MRTLLFTLLMVLTTPAIAAGWASYENARFGYVLDVPPDYVWGAEAPNGDGRKFRSESGTQLLTVWGGNILEDNFEAAAAASIGVYASEGWNITYQAITPSWASYSGTRGKKVLYVRMIGLCEDTQYATFSFEYATNDIAKLDPVVNRLVPSLRASGHGVGC